MRTVAAVRLDWQERAACRGIGSALFFGPDGERGRDRAVREREAMKICAGCPVRTDCLEHALRTPEDFGVWGGTGEEDRAAERRRRRSAA